MYLALYRKYRPKKFADVVGQKHIVKTLLNQITANRISHAYLFCGTHGTGKTSIAKIFAMAVNCFDNKNGEPCMKCESCKNVLSKQDPNIIEIDAASNNGVDNIRDIRDEVKYPPINGKYKIYIIDEVHMLSVGAFNALLKTLEEPPSHVIFILATTDPQKIPATIHSRTQRFDFKRILPQEMFDAIKKYMEAEKINISDEAINYVIRLSDGAMRDALSILDQCISFYFGEEISLSKVINITGNIDDKNCCEFLNALNEKNVKKILDMTNKIVMDGKEISHFLSALIMFLRDCLVFKNIGDDENVLQLWNDRAKILQNCQLSSPNQIKLLEVFSQLQNELKYAINPRISFEISCIKFCSDDEKKNIIQTNNEIKISKKIDMPVKKIIPYDVKELIKKWPQIVAKSSGLLKEILNLSYIGSLKNNVVYIITNDAGSNAILKQKKDEIKNLIDLDCEIDFICKDDYEAEHKKIFNQDDEELKKQLKKINFPIES